MLCSYAIRVLKTKYVKVSIYFAVGVIQNKKHLGLSIIVSSVVAFLKSSNMTEGYVNRIRQAVMNDTSHDADLVAEEIKGISNSISGNIDSCIIKDAIQRLRVQLSPNALSLSIMLNHTAGMN